MDTPIEQFNLKILEECLECIRLNVSHIDKKQADVFACNLKNSNIFNGLFLTVNSLRRLICNYQWGWLYDFIFTFFTTVLNVLLEYDLTPGLSDTSLVFDDTQDNANRVNHCICTNEFKYSNLDRIPPVFT